MPVMSSEGAEVGNVLAKRYRCLRALVDGPAAKRDLVEALDLPRTTLDRAVRELTDAGLAERSDGGYRATVLGREALDAHECYLRRLDGLVAGAPLFAALPADTPLGGAFFEGATVTESAPAAPDRVLETLLDSVEETVTFRGVAPVAITGHVDAFYAAVTDEGEVPELLVDHAVLDHLIAAQGSAVREQVEDGNVHLRAGPVPFRFGLWLVDDSEAGVVVYTDTGVRGVAVNDTAEAVAWACERYETAYADSERVTAATLDAYDGA